MAPRPRFSLLTRKKQDNILDSAADEFGTYGYEGASINRIIKTAGISKGVAYYYFDDKKDLFATVIEHSFEKILSIVGEFDIQSLNADNFWEDIEEQANTGLLMFRDQQWVRRAAKIFWNYHDTHPDSVAVRGVWTTIYKSIEDILLHGQKLGVVRTDVPNELLISMFFGMGTAFDRWMLENVEELSADEFDKISVFITSAHRLIAEPSTNKKTLKSQKLKR